MVTVRYHIFSNKRQTSIKRHPLISAARLDIHIEASASLEERILFYLFIFQYDQVALVNLTNCFHKNVN